MTSARTAVWLIAAYCLLPTAASATETLFAEVDINSAVAGCTVPAPYSSNTDGASVGATCGDSQSVGSAAAIVQHGRVGASSSATDVTVSMGTGGQAAWGDDQVLITAVGNPGQLGTVTASLNFIFDGGFGGFGAPSSNTVAFLDVAVNGALFGVELQHADNGDSCQNFSPIDFCGHFNNSVGLPVALTTPTLTLPLGTPFSVGYDINVSSTAFGPGASTDGNFLHTVGFNAIGPVLNFTDPGFTVNAGSYIVDNAYIAPVDEPETLSLLAGGLGVLLLRRRHFAAKKRERN